MSQQAVEEAKIDPRKQFEELTQKYLEFRKDLLFRGVDSTLEVIYQFDAAYRQIRALSIERLPIPEQLLVRFREGLEYCQKIFGE